MLTVTDKKQEVISSQETEHSRELCVHCNQNSFDKNFEAYDFDTGKKSFALETCANCQLTRTTPVLHDEELSAYYESSYYGSSDKKFNPLIESWTIWSNNRLAKTILSSFQATAPNRENIKVLDIGCGRANLLKAFRRQGCECYGVERADFPPSDDTKEITIYKQDLAHIPVEKASLDIVVIWHVLEHLVDPSATLKRIHELLKPDGLLVIAVPNFGGLQSRIFGKHWFHLDLPRHTYHFTKTSLNNMTRETGFTIEATSTNSPDQSIFGFIQSTLNMLGSKKPNTLYSILKTQQNKPKLLTVILQLFAAGVLAPFSIVEYILSTMTGTGACLIIKCKKSTQVND